MELAERQYSLSSPLSRRWPAGSRPSRSSTGCGTGRWERLARGRLPACGIPHTWEQRLIALTFAAGPAAAASHRSAAALLGIPGFERRGLVEVTTPRPRRHRAEGELVHRWRPFPAHHLTVIEGIVTTRVARTLCDLAGVLHPGRTERAIDNCLAMGIATPGTLQAAFCDLASRGRKGTAVMRRLLAERSEGYVPPASELEARFRDLVREAGLPEPVRQLDVGDDERGSDGSTSPTRRPACSSSSTAAATTRRSSTGRPTPPATDGSGAPAGGSSASPGTTSSRGPTGWCPSSAACSARAAA